jgi:hypothetical protein
MFKRFVSPSEPEARTRTLLLVKKAIRALRLSSSAGTVTAG